MPKALKDILNGVKSSKVVPGSTGSDPGVDYAPKAPNEQQFVKKHKIEKHEDRVGNGDDVYQASNVKHSQVGEPNHGYKKPEDKNINEEIKSKNLREIAKNPYAIGMAAAMKQTGDKPPLKKSTITKAHDIAKSVKEDVEQIDEVSRVKLQDYKSAAELSRKTTEDQKTYTKRSKGIQLAKSKLKEPVGTSQGRGYVKVKGTSLEKYSVFPVYKKPKVYATEETEEVEDFNSGAEHGAGSTEQMQEASTFPVVGEDSDESAEMAKTQLRALANKALHLAMQLNDDQVVEPWVQSKIAVAKDYVTAVHDYMLYGDHESKSKENEQTAPYDGGIDMTGAPRNTYPSFSADVNTGRVV
jgi:hypothetical protein